MGDEELKKKKKIRGGHKGYVTITLEKAQALLDEFELSVANQVKTYRIALTENLNILSALNEEFLTLITEEYIEDEIRETAVTVDNDLKRLRLLYDRVKAPVQALQALGIHSESYGKLLVLLLMEKLPPNMRLTISRAINRPEWDLNVMLKAFDSEIKARERCESIGTNPLDSFTPKRPFSSQANKGKHVPTGATLTNRSEHPISCTFCKQSHPSASFGTVTDISARRNLLKQQGRCFVCLRRNHLARNCSLNKVCRICSGNHHMSICENANRGKGTTEIQSRGSSVVVSDLGERRSNENKSSTTVYVDSNTSIQSAKSTGPSLNDCLHAGPSLISDIPDVLMRFRYHQIALAADIEKAFLMVQVAKADRDVLRFLWINDPTSEDPNIVVKRFNRVVFGVTSSPFLLKGTVRHHVSNYEVEDPQFVNDFLSSLYEDDFNGCKDSVPEAFQLYTKAKSRMKEGGFNLRKWISNSEKLMQWINQEEGVPIMEASMVSVEDKTYTQTQLGVNNSTISCERKILGLNWDIEKDTFMFYFDWLVQFARELPLNKRSVLKVVAKLYDPLGLISPLFITVKAMFQDLCKLKIGWDKPLDEELTLRYSSWLSDLLKVKCIQIERRYEQTQKKTCPCCSSPGDQGR